MNKENKSGLNKINGFLLSLQNIKTKDKVVFYRLLATMTDAGMSLINSIGVLEKQQKNAIFKGILQSFIVDLKTGNTLSECMNKFGSSFSDAEIGIIKSGEKTGKLNNVLGDLATQVEKVASMSGKLKSALMYPGFIILVVIGVVFIMMTKVVPNLLTIFGYDPNLPSDSPINIEAVEKLPNSTQTLIGISNLFTNYWYLMIFGFILLVILISIWKKTLNGRYLFDKYLLKLPIMGDVTKKIVLSKFSRTFSGLVASGVSIVESLHIVAEAVGNEVYRQRILLLAQDVKGGIKIFESIEGDKLFPEMMIQMIRVGEETAKLDKTILKISEFYDEQVDNTIRTINKLLEPFIIVTLAVLVGGIAVGIMEPIMNLADTISNT